VSRLRISLLGPFEVWRDGQFLPPSAWPGHKARQILKILVTHRQRVVASDELIEWLWPDLRVGSARNSLWVAVSRLRRLLGSGRDGPAFILTEPPGYRFDAAGRCEIDVDLFLGHLHQGHEQQRRGAWETAVVAYGAAEALYRGDYLAEDPYEDWAIPPRERMREAFLELQGSLATCQLSLRRYREALVHCHRSLEQDTCRESAWRLAMECYYRAGERGQALRAFERCRAALARELGVDPLPETLALHERILRDAAPQDPQPRAPTLPGSSAPPLSLPFVGRDHEWTLVSQLLQQALGGQGQVVLVTGEPGIGKTRVLEELASLATARGARVLSGRCYELEGNVAYAPVVEALRASLLACPPFASMGAATDSPPPPPCPAAQMAAVAELLPELRRLCPDLPSYQSLPPEEERLRVLAGLAQIVFHSARGGPLVLLLDDLHWADPSTLQLLHFLGRQVDDQPLLLVGAYRSTQVDARHPLSVLRAQLGRQGVLTELPLPPLGHEDVVLLLRSLGSERQGDEFARHLHRDTEGHPFFLAEVLRTLVHEGLITVDAQGRWQTAYDALTDSYQELLLPASVRAAVLGRLGHLPPGDRGLLDQASVIGRAFRLSLLAHLLQRPERLLAEQVEGLALQGFLRPRPPDGYEFSHDLTRRAAYEALSEPRRRLLHRQVADALLELRAAARADGDEIAGRVATHYAASDRPWLALEHALAAAEQAARVAAFDEAMAWCRQANEIVAGYPTAVPAGFRARLHLQCRALWYYRGDLERTLAAGRAALAAARQEGDAAAQLQALWHLAHDETQVMAGGTSGVQAQALELARYRGDPAELARSLARLGSDAGFLALPEERGRSLAYLEQAVTLARGVGDPLLLHQVLTEWWGIGRASQARVALEEGLVLARQLGDGREEAGTLAKLADVLARQGDFAAAVTYAQEGLALAGRVDSPPYGAWNERALGQALVALGRVEEGLAHLERAARTFEAHAWRTMLAGTLLRLGLALSVRLPPQDIAQGVERGEPAVVALERALSLSQETREPYEAAYALAALGRLRLARGEMEAGRRALEEAAALAPCIGLPWHRGGTLVQVAAGRLLLDQVDAALCAADEVVRLAEVEDLREVRAHALLLRGQALVVLGFRDKARPDLEAGLAQAEAIGNAGLGGQLRRALADF
jgi:DNA-binding SARP family transcriptional activator